MLLTKVMLIKKAGTLLTTYIIEENMFVHVEWSPVKHAASQVSVRKKSSKKKKRKKEREWQLDGLTSQVQVLPVFYLEVLCTKICWFYITLKTSECY